ncbi:MAG: LamG domain-containing protein, partial [Melioribacteraceae bacterium]|nr:LamG domain-containing protein [Melioribacteraceae bacterium]
GDKIKPDKNNIYSYVRIIEESGEKILVHWRYIPDFANPNFDGVVHEYYTILPDGQITRIIKKGKGDLVEYRDEKNVTTQKLQLGENGITEIGLELPTISQKTLPKIEGSKVISKTPTNPDLWLKFDEGMSERSFERRNITVEAVNNIDFNIEGNLALWKKGISGSALAFDGYYSKVNIKSESIKNIQDSFTIEAWIALGAYPWRWGPIADIRGNGAGFYFGINEIGQLGCKLIGNEKETIVKSDKELNVFEWAHVAANIDNEQLRLNLFINGELVKSENLTDAFPFPINNDISIGLNKFEMDATDHVSRDYKDGGRTPLGNQPMIYGIEGLIDEIKMYDRSLTEKEINISYTNSKATKDVKGNPDMEKRILPGHVDGKNAEKFGAYYTNLKYHELWDNLWRSSPYPDIVVRFDELPANVVYWRGPNYGPGWVTENNIWMSDQSCEIYHEYGCAEHMADKQNRHSHVRLLENHDARVVVHWRYASIDILYQFENDRIWADEYHYIYPDGSAIRYVTYHDDEIPGWQDVQFFAQPGTTPEDQIHLQALTVANLDGEVHKMDWSNGVPDNELDDANISIVNFKSEYKVMVIYPEGDEIGAWGHIERATEDTYFAGPWNHWPVGQMPNDGRYAMRTDRITHSALGGAGPRDKAIFGFTNKDISELLPLARFWNRSPEIRVEQGAENAEFKMSEKAYTMDVTGDQVDIDIISSEDSPLLNPAFVLKNWNGDKANISLNGKQITIDKDCRVGVRKTELGKDLVVWLKLNESSPIQISFAK